MRLLSVFKSDLLNLVDDETLDRLRKAEMNPRDFAFVFDVHNCAQGHLRGKGCEGGWKGQLGSTMVAI